MGPSWSVEFQGRLRRGGKAVKGLRPAGIQAHRGYRGRGFMSTRYAWTRAADNTQQQGSAHSLGSPWAGYLFTIPYTVKYAAICLQAFISSGTAIHSPRPISTCSTQALTKRSALHNIHHRQPRQPWYLSPFRRPHSDATAHAVTH